MTNLSGRSESPRDLRSQEMLQQNKQEARSNEEKSESSKPTTSPSSLISSSNEHQRKPSTANRRNPDHWTGRWTLDEKLLFLYGLKKYGKGRWKKISVYLPHRSLVQIKSHGQKVLKRYENGENVFRRLVDNQGVIEALVANIHSQMGIQAPPPTPIPEQKPKHGFGAPLPQATTTSSSTDHALLAASALCQLAGPPQEAPGSSVKKDDSPAPQSHK